MTDSPRMIAALNGPGVLSLMHRWSTYQAAVFGLYEQICREEQQTEALEQMRAADDGMPGFVARHLPIAPIEIVL